MNWYLIYILDIDECLWPIDKDVKKTVFQIGNAYFENIYGVRLIATDIFPTFAYYIVECSEEYTEAFSEELMKNYNANCVIKLFRKMEDRIVRESLFDFDDFKKDDNDQNEKQSRTLNYAELAAAKDKNKEEAKKEYKEKGYISTDMFEKIRENVSKEHDIIAKQVLNGLWGTGREKENRLRQAGYNHVTIQNRVDEMTKKIKQYHVWINIVNQFSMGDAQWCGVIQGIAYVMCVEPCGTILYDVERFGSGCRLVVETSEDRIKKFEERVKKIIPYEIIVEKRKIN